MSSFDLGADRRTVLLGTAAAAATMMFSTVPGFAADDIADFKKIIGASHGEALKRLQDWIAHPTIAAEGRNVKEGAEYMANLAKEAGFQHVEIVPTSGVPGVFATLDAGAPKTMGLYFMYDVKQFDPTEWSSPPLAGALVDKPNFGKSIVGRGAVNQKGPEATFLAALAAFRKLGRKLPVNLVLVCEGEEEIGSPHFGEIVRRPDITAALSKCVGVTMPSASQDTTGGVNIQLGAKGIVEAELISSGAHWGRGPSHDVHSSLKAAVDSPTWRLIHALNTLVSADGNTITVDGWYDNVRAMTPREKEIIDASVKVRNEKAEMAALGVTHWIDNLPFDKAMERLASQPTVNIEGLVAGYTGPGGKTILPSKAVAKIDCRLVPNQTYDEACRKLRAHLDKHGFPDIEFNPSGGYDPNETSEKSALIQGEIALYTRLGYPPSLNPRSAGSWPGYIFTGAPLKLPASHYGMGYGTGAHAPNEFYVIESSNPKIFGMDDSTLAYVQYLYQIAAVG
ncbi:MAG: M20/M25/M40 family metallo-hydrolase [Alphaproteobacteria bacterium]|nr:M20/M25/M40 family metallo-hydrolase [Alphaproteobacteria bacterium]MBL6936271.1 M20/M25/M40 family metallo-hydrolase [Alphaproteobacteria bacterium]MBL7098678.1 M20/M25/M40 family metallo-hydrolase [Alphaproteobacteria bacterium]